MGLIQANFGSNMSWVDFGFVSNGFSYKQWPLHSCYRVFRWPRQISFHPKRGHMIWKQQKSKNLGFEAKSSHCPLQSARGQCQIANCKCQGPRANSQVQIANWQVRLPSAKGKLQIARGQGPGISHKRGQHQSKTYPLQKNQGFDSKGFEFQSWIAMVLVQISIGQCQGAKGQRPIANYQLRLQMAKGQGQIARGQRQGISHKIHKNQVKPYKIQSKTKDFDSQDFGFRSWFAMVL